MIGLQFPIMSFFSKYPPFPSLISSHLSYSIFIPSLTCLPVPICSSHTCTLSLSLCPLTHSVNLKSPQHSILSLCLALNLPSILSHTHSTISLSLSLFVLSFLLFSLAHFISFISLPLLQFSLHFLWFIFSLVYSLLSSLL